SLCSCHMWLNPLFKIGYERKLKPDDLYSVLPEDRSQHLGEELQGYWDQEVLRAKKDAREPSLMRAIVKCYWKFYFIWGLLTFLESPWGHSASSPLFWLSLLEVCCLGGLCSPWSLSTALGTWVACECVRAGGWKMQLL
ncbi:hypothetical protein FD755_024399, partial [Muntiacus reevesi]